jgi:translation initiation factor 3 subunit C
VSSFFRSANDSESDSSSSEEEELLSSGSESEAEAPAPKAPAAAAAAKPKRNLLRKTGSGSSSSSSSDSDSDSGSDSDASERPVKKAADAPKPKGGRFLKGAASDDSSDEDRGKVVKSAKSKRADEVDASVKTIENGAKINDWVTISNGSSPSFSFSPSHLLTLSHAEFDKLVRLVSRLGTTNDPVPSGFYKVLSSLDEMVASAQSNKKKMNATNSKSLNSMKQKVKKTQREHEDALNRYKAVRPFLLFSPPSHERN